MAAFRFAFMGEPEEAEIEASLADQEAEEEARGEGAQYMPAFELRPDREFVALDPAATEELHLSGPAKGLTLLKGRVSSQAAAQMLRDERCTHSDLIPGVNEGGFKLWECAIDLCNYLAQKYGLTSDIMHSVSAHRPLQGKKVLELGCGHGIPGILALLAGAEVHFQDFNEEVIKQLTIPNVVANLERLPRGMSKPSYRFFSGDWSSVGELLTSQGLGGHYDLILTAETIYNVGSQGQLLECIKQVLQPPHGMVMVAAKSYYFGVGGGVQSFEKAIRGDNLFDVSHAHKTCEDVAHMVTAAGVQPKEPLTNSDPKATSGLYREVLELTFPISIQPYFL